MTWLEEARAIIRKVHETLPSDADLATRRKACLAAKPHWFSATSWGNKVWPKAQREYLEQYGLPPLKKPEPTLFYISPLERAKARYEALRK